MTPGIARAARLVAPALLALLAGGCVAPDGGAGAGGLRPPLDTVLDRLPQEASGFGRGVTTDMEASQPGQGRAVDYATLAGPDVAARAAVAAVTLYDHGMPPLPPDTPVATVTVKLEEGVAEALNPAPGRSMAESTRHVLPAEGGGPLQCAVLEGTYGRSPMWQQVCVGVAAGRFLKVFVAVPTRQKTLLQLDADAFTLDIARAARGLAPVPPRPLAGPAAGAVIP
ncbi:hypothetical protein ACFOD4_16380 [Pseudoroseomonas globiformis]|uniref:Lipoprotein n=1 Tax=Teichococcus globiformis TaxID=2307229 RepID=A0ABV7G473_9PROT